MFKKGNTHFADWREADGTRKRKAFTSAKDAAAHEKAMKLNARPRTASGRSRPSLRRTAGVAAKAITTLKKQPDTSSPQAASYPHGSSERATLSKPSPTSQKITHGQPTLVAPRRSVDSSGTSSSAASTRNSSTLSRPSQRVKHANGALRRPKKQ